MYDENNPAGGLPEEIDYTPSTPKKEGPTGVSAPVLDDFEYVAPSSRKDGPTGVSAPVLDDMDSYAPENGKNFAELYKFARKALDSVVSENKHGTAVYSNYSKFSEWRRDLASASKLFDESDVASGACRISANGFGPVYRYFVRYVQSYCRSAFKMLFTLSCIKEPYNGMSFISERFSELIAQKLRKSDLLVQLSDDQFFLVLPEINEQDAHKLAQRIVNVWENSDFSDGIELQYEAGQIPIDVDSQKHFRSSDK